MGTEPNSSNKLCKLIRRHRDLPLGLGNDLFLFNELGFLRRSLECRRGTKTLLHYLGNRVEISSSNLSLMFNRSKSVVRCGKLFFLKIHKSRHPTPGVIMGQVKHGVVKGMESCEGYKLVFISHTRNLFLKSGNVSVSQILSPIEGR